MHMTRTRAVVLSVVATLGVLLTPTLAGAQSYTASNAQSDATGFAGTLFSAAAPIVLAIATAAIGIALLTWGVRTVYRKVRGVHV